MPSEPAPSILCLCLSRLLSTPANSDCAQLAAHTSHARVPLCGICTGQVAAADTAGSAPAAPRPVTLLAFACLMQTASISDFTVTVRRRKGGMLTSLHACPLARRWTVPAHSHELRCAALLPYTVHMCTPPTAHRLKAVHNLWAPHACAPAMLQPPCQAALPAPCLPAPLQNNTYITSVSLVGTGSSADTVEACIQGCADDANCVYWSW